jgi:CHAT domain-containing protein
VRKGFMARPLVFLNACEVGGQRLSLDGAGGFANAFIELNAAAVVAPLWAVEDVAAGLVTRSFYKDVLKGVPLAKALQRIRQRAYSKGATMDSFAAYCLYGDPLAVAVTE